MTYSVVARDPASGALGVAVQSCFFAVGAVVPWARPGVGAVATQAFADTAYGHRCLDALAAGSSPAEALSSASAADPAAFLRQVGVVAADGSVAAHTGAGCIDHMSAALLVVGGAPGGGRLVDLRVDRSTDPLGELARLLDAADAYDRFNRATQQLFGGDAHAALTDLDAGLGILPGEPNLAFLRAAALLTRGDTDAGRRELRSLLVSRPTWEVILRSYAAKGLLPMPASASIDALIG
jgi:uncharacterized Ntn-hydrolase superfamily protein